VRGALRFSFPHCYGGCDVCLDAFFKQGKEKEEKKEKKEIL